MTNNIDEAVPGKAIGIDLGTTNSLAAVDEGDGNPIVLRTRRNESFTPSVVSFRDGSLLVGREAWDNAAESPRDTVFSIKRLMGRTFDNSEVKKLKELSPFSIIELSNSQTGVMIDGKKHKPEDISAIILRKVVEDAREALGGEPVTHAVITVPAYFNDNQRLATRVAGEQAGLIVKKIVDEPTAAAVAFGVADETEYSNLMVFDMGGGTLDISILNVKGRKLTGDSIRGDMWMGGDNFDAKLVEMFSQWIRTYYGIDPSGDKKYLMVARRKAIEAKIALSRKPRVTVIIPGIVPLGDGGKGEVAITVTREEYAERIAPDIDRCMGLVDEVLDNNDLDVEQISGVLLVGGATYTPELRERLKEKFGADKVRHDLNPMEAVACGAAILASQLKGVICPAPGCGHENPYEARECRVCGRPLASGRVFGGVELNEVTEQNFGIRVIDDDEDPDCFSIIIPAGTPYPLSEPRKKKFMSTSRKIKVPVYVGEKIKASENEYLGTVEFDLPRDAPSNTEVEISFNYDLDRILTVGIEVVGRPDLNLFTTPKRYAPSSEVNDEQLIFQLRNVTDAVKNMVDEYGEFFQDYQKEEMETAIKQSQRALQQNDARAARETLQKLVLLRECDETVYILQVAENLARHTEPSAAAFLVEHAKKLRDAYREKPQDMGRVKQIKRVLECKIMNELEKINPSLEIKALTGFVRELAERRKDEEESAGS